MTITLTGHRIIIDPPQPLIMLIVLTDGEEELFTIAHKAGTPLEGNVTEAPLPQDPRTVARVGDLVTSGMNRLALAFPKMGLIDLHNLGPEYKAYGDVDIVTFEFAPGDRYVVALVGVPPVTQRILAR